jgi:HEAT repeat protein
LGDRQDTIAFAKLAGLAKSSSSSAQRPIYQSLGALAGERDLPALVDLVTGANDETSRAMATESLNSAVQRLRIKKGKIDPSPILAGLKSGSAESRGALLQVCAGFHDEQVRTALRSALADSDQNLRAAAIRALSDTTDPELLPDLVDVACKLPEGTLRNLAIGGSVRLTTQEESVTLPPSTRLAALKQILATPLKAEQKRVILAGLAELPDPDALAIAEGMLGDEAVKAEAARAVVRLAPAVPDTAAGTSALKRVLQVATEPALRQEAQAALKQLEARADFLTKWQAAGPYLQAGKDYAALFDIAFPPETADKADVKWETIPACTDPKRPWSMDLLKMWGGEQRVGYARTWIHSDTDQKVVSGTRQ